MQAVNPQAERLLTCRADEVRGVPLSRLIATDPPDAFKEAFERILAGGRHGRLDATSLTDADRRRAVSLSIGPLDDPEGIGAGAAIVVGEIGRSSSGTGRPR